MSKSSTKSILGFLALIIVFFNTTAVIGADFTIANGDTETTQQSLVGSQTGTVDAGGTLDVASTAVGLSGGNNTLTNNGTIISGQYGVSVSGADNNITNIGTIESGNTAVQSGAGYLMVENNGTITSSIADGIYLWEGNAINSGTIEADLFGVYSLFGDVTNSGTITSSNGEGVHIWEGNAINSGTIDAYDVGLWAETGDVNNSGSITSSASHGVRVGSGNAINSGTIDSYGIGLWAESGDVNNSGTITSSDIGLSIGYGIYAKSGDVTNSGTVISKNIGINVWTGDVTNSGTVKSSQSNGVSVKSGNVTNSGVIEAKKNGFAGILVENGNVTNSGTIEGGGLGIVVENGDVTNSGTIKGVYNAVSFSWYNNTLNILPGSRLYGGVDLGAGTDTVNIYGSTNGTYVSSAIDFQNAETINLIGGAPALVNGNVVNIIDQSADAYRASNIASTTSAINGVLLNRLTHKGPSKPVQLASLELAPGMFFKEEPARAWGEVFTFERERDGEGNSFGFEQTVTGATFGYDFDSKGKRVGFTAGFASSTSETNVQSVETDSSSLYLGGYGRFNLGKVNLTTTLTIGTESHENIRYVIAGLNTEQAKSDYDSFFINPSVTVDSAYKVKENIELRPSATVSYTTADYDGYRETGTTASNLKVKGLTATALTSSAQLALAYLNDKSEIEVRVGGKLRETNSDDIGVSLSGANFKYSVSADDSVSGAYGGLYVRHAINDSSHLTANIEATSLSGGEDQFFGKVGFDLNF